MSSPSPRPTSSRPHILVVGAGIGGLTAAALLAKRGYRVSVYDLAIVPGGCASTFQRRGFTFDVGATQVAGLEPGGIHHRIFSELGIDLPEATPCDPSCAVVLPGETEPINIWRDRDKWRAERQRQFPGSEPFWQLMETMFEASWAFQSRDPVLPPRDPWDVWQLTQALRLDTLVTVPFTFATVGDVLRLFGLEKQQRLRTFLDLQLKLYSQVDAENTAFLYAATALGVSQTPQGLYHLHGSMQVLSDRLVSALEHHGGTLKMRHAVTRLTTDSQRGDRVVSATIRNVKTGETLTESYDAVVANVTVQNLVSLLEDATTIDPATRKPTLPRSMRGYRQRVETLPPASGAFVIYLGVDAAAIPDGCPPHLQFLYDPIGPIAENNSLFVSVSRDGDGRAPDGCATIIASSFTDTDLWWDDDTYADLKQRYTDEAIARLSSYFHLTPATIIYCEAATPKTFQSFTGRDRGVVGGIGQRVPTFGPFGFANRTPLPNLWLVGDCTHPGEGTAGVSYSALTAVRQLERSV